MSIQIDVWSDFVCPWCYLVSTSLNQLQASHDVSITWKSYELRPKGSPPMPEAYRARIQSMFPQLKAMAREKYGIEIGHGPMGIESRMAHIGMKYAEANGQGKAYHKAVFEAYWLESKDISDIALLKTIAEQVGLNGDDFEAHLQDHELEAEVITDIQQAQAYGISGVPALIFENRYYISGAQPYDTLVQALEQIEEHLANEA